MSRPHRGQRLLDSVYGGDMRAAGPWLAVIVVVVLGGAVMAMTRAAPADTDQVTALAAIGDEGAEPAALAAPAGAEPAPEPAAEPVPEPAAEPTPVPDPEPTPTPELAPVPLPIEAPPTESVREPIDLVPAPEGLEAFAGLSTWVDVYDIDWTPEQQAEVARLGGAQAIYVQSARHVSEGDIHDPERLGRLIDAAHERGLKVMVWYIPDFLDPEHDLRRSVAAIEFTSPRGNRADAFGLDIELEELADVGLRSRRLIELSARLRAHVGPDYPMAAVVLPPLQLDLRRDWWPDFPWREIAPYYDVWIPMSYSSFRGTGAQITYSWNLDNVLELRRRVGDPSLPVHLAGGIADNLPAVDAFVDAARDGRVLGAGLYDLDTTPSSAWPQLRALRTHP